VEHLVLAVAQSVHGFGVERVVRSALGELNPAAGEERPDAVPASFAVHVALVVGACVERDERLAGALRPGLQIRVEHGLPRAGVDAGGIGEHTIEVEQAGRYPLGQTQHSGPHFHRSVPPAGVTIAASTLT
jgi:hypothetical protein